MAYEEIQEQLQSTRDSLNLKIVTLPPDQSDIMALGEVLRILEEFVELLKGAGWSAMQQEGEALNELLGGALLGNNYVELLTEFQERYSKLDEHLDSVFIGVADPEAFAKEAVAAAEGEAPAAPEEPEEVVQEVPEDLLEDETLVEFISECEEGLEQTEETLLQLEKDPTDSQAVNAIFRIVHTIKGTSGFLGLSVMGTLAHRTEDLLVQARDGKRVMDPDTVDVVLRAVDALRQMVGQVKDQLAGGRPTPVRLVEVRQQLKALLEGESPAAAAPPAPAAPSAPEAPPASAEPLSGAEDSPKNSRVEEHELEGRRVTGVDEIELPNYKPEIERNDAGAAQEAIAQFNLEGVVNREVDLSALTTTTEPEPEPRAPEVPPASVPAATATPSPKVDPPPSQEKAPAAPEVEHPETQRRQGAATQPVDMIKIPAPKLDELSEFIGEMVVALSVLSQNPTIQQIEDRVMHERMDQLHKITEQLRDRILSIRMLPVKNVFSKLNRQVRDLSRKSGKQIDLVIEGEETLVDKTIIDGIYAPLMHLVRNAIDHGIENAEERSFSGKEPAGKVRLGAHHQGDAVLIEVGDDGRGLVREKILNKAMERGLTTDRENLSDQQVFNFIFQAGFSTAAQVTDVSGRGVGMDVVKREVDALRGKITIESNPGFGTRFLIKLPLTTSIIEGLVVRLGESRFVLPILEVHLTITPKKSELYDIQGQQKECFLLAGEVVPIIRLYDYYHITPEFTDPSQGLIVVVNEGEKKFGLMVDELLHRQQIVVKNLGERFKRLPGITGGTILGDGRVGLILDPERLLADNHHANAS
jgi:two-component system chemotaxis sensor kinase CheA